jgi:hypothetical protein
MSLGWNFERRRDTCTRFLLGVSILTRGVADAATNLEAVRHRMGLSPEEALFAARQLGSEQAFTFEPGGSIRSNARGLEKARTLAANIGQKLLRHEEAVRILAAGGTPLLAVAAVLRHEGGTLQCGSPEAEPDAQYRLNLVGTEVQMERMRPDGTFAPIAVP